jgi:hypothetical protein
MALRVRNDRYYVLAGELIDSGQIFLEKHSSFAESPECAAKR